MKIKHITISSGSYGLLRKIIPRLKSDFTVSYLIKNIIEPPQAKIILNDSVDDIRAIQPILNILMKYGIPEEHIDVHTVGPTPKDILLKAIPIGLRKSRLSFGPDVAEKDDGLSRYFIETLAFNHVKTNKKHILVGPKGSGKSAIIRELSKENKHTMVITPEHYATEVLGSILNKRLTSELGAFIITWKYSLLIEIFKKINSDQIGDTPSVTRIRNYLAENGHLSSELTLFERFITYLKKISAVKGKIGPAELTLDSNIDSDLNKLFKMGDLLALLPSLKSALRNNLLSVYIDELDQSWDNSDLANKFLISLLTAAIQLRGIDDNLHVIVFLRSEIFELIKPFLSQLDKLRSDIEVLRWEKQDLQNLIASRALVSLKINEDLQSELVISSLFPGSISEYNIPNFEYILSRTAYRPREVIQFCNLSLENAIRENLGAISQESILRAEEEFSEWKLEHIISENLFIYPKLDEIFNKFRGKSKFYPLNIIDSLLTETLLDLQESKTCPEWLKTINNPIDLLNILYNLEIIGIEKNNIINRDYRLLVYNYEFVYERPKGKVEKSLSFLFHPALWKTLELV